MLNMAFRIESIIEIFNTIHLFAQISMNIKIFFI